MSHELSIICHELQGRQFLHGEKPVASSQEEFIDTATEADLTSYFESNSNLFKSEGGRLCASFGEQYKYNGSTSPSTPVAIPPVLQALVDKVNTELCSEGQPQINSCLVNCFEGPPSSLPLHSDDEKTIHPESSIHTISIGSSCTVSFVSNQNSEKHDHVCHTRSIYSMTRRSQEFYKHHIETGSIASGTRYSITLRSVSHKNRNSTAVIGDSNTGKLKFGTDPRKTFGKWLPGKQFYAPVISDINPYVACGYQNIVIHCGVNDLKGDDVKNISDVRRVFNAYVDKIQSVQAVNPKAHVYVCPPLPSKRAELNRKSIYFNKLIGSELLPNNFGVTFVDGFDEFCDQTGLLSPLLSQGFD